MLYARFMLHFLASEGLVTETEPFKRLIMMGMVLGDSFKVEHTGKYLTKDQIDFSGELCTIFEKSLHSFQFPQ